MARTDENFDAQLERYEEEQAMLQTDPAFEAWLRTIDRTRDEVKEEPTCPYCGGEIIGVRAGDEVIDFCSECDECVEGVE